MREEVEGQFGGRWALENDPIKAAHIMLTGIEANRDALGINSEAERKLYDMAARRELTF